MGGIAVLAFTSRYCGLVRAVAAIDIAITSGPRRRHYLRRLRAIPTISYPDLTTAKARFRLMPNEGDIAPQLLSNIAEHSIQSVRLPVLLVRGEHSRIMTVEPASNACRANPLVELVTIPNAHHHIPLEAPGPLARVIEQFVAAHN
jgi:pimeloyl-ACP methyl ester carboxylesterase